MTNLTRIVRGALVGYTASRTMDVATTWFYRRQDQSSKTREQELAPGGTLVQLGRQLGRLVGRDLDDAAAERAGVALHRTFGPTYGVIASVLAGRGMPPLRAGPTIAAVA